MTHGLNQGLQHEYSIVVTLQKRGLNETNTGYLSYFRDEEIEQERQMTFLKDTDFSQLLTPPWLFRTLPLRLPMQLANS